MKSDAFVNAVHARSREQLEQCFADECRFLSPVVFAPYEGKDVVITILVEGAFKVFDADNFEFLTSCFTQNHEAAVDWSRFGAAQKV